MHVPIDCGLMSLNNLPFIQAPGTSAGSLSSAPLFHMPTPVAQPRFDPFGDWELSESDHVEQQQAVGVDASELRGKTLRHISRSKRHPALTLYFTDGTAYQVLVCGYDPINRGLPKRLEMDAAVEAVFNPRGGFADANLKVLDAQVITLKDKAFHLGSPGAEWYQDHRAFAIKFEADGHWHCVWSTLTDWQTDAFAQKRCVFRTFHDVYLEACHRPLPERSTKPKSKKKYWRQRWINNPSGNGQTRSW